MSRTRELLWTATTQKLKVAQEMYRSGQYTVAAIATTLGVSRASVYRHLSDVVS